VSKDEYFNVRYQIKSFMIWIWISGILIAIGGMSTFYRRSYEK
jgi:cytochrome c-type biogenesis protein CcmF